MSSDCSPSDISLPLRTRKPSSPKCPKCPHRLQDYASEHEQAQTTSVASMVGSDGTEKGLVIPKREEQISGWSSPVLAKEGIQQEVTTSKSTDSKEELKRPSISGPSRKKSVSFHEIDMVAYVPVDHEEEDPEDDTSNADSEYKNFPALEDDAEEYHADAEWADFYAEMAIKYPSEILPRIPEPSASENKGKERAEEADKEVVRERPQVFQRGSSGGSVTKSILRRKSSVELVMKSSSSTSSKKSVRFDEECKQIDGKRKKCQFEVGPESDGGEGSGS